MYFFYHNVQYKKVNLYIFLFQITKNFDKQYSLLIINVGSMY